MCTQDNSARPLSYFVIDCRIHFPVDTHEHLFIFVVSKHRTYGNPKTANRRQVDDNCIEGLPEGLVLLIGQVLLIDFGERDSG